MITNRDFEGLAAITARALGLREARMAVLEGPAGSLSPEDLAAVQRRAMGDILLRLTEVR